MNKNRENIKWKRKRDFSSLKSAKKS